MRGRGSRRHTLRELAPHQRTASSRCAQRARDRGGGDGIELESADGKRHYLVSYYPVAGPDGRRGIGETVVRRHPPEGRRASPRGDEPEAHRARDHRRADAAPEPAHVRASSSTSRSHARAAAGSRGRRPLSRPRRLQGGQRHARARLRRPRCSSRWPAAARRRRETDVVARVGGDEFVVLLADLDVAGGARARGDRRRDGFAQLLAPIRSRSTRSSCARGVHRRRDLPDRLARSRRAARRRRRGDVREQARDHPRRLTRSATFAVVPEGDSLHRAARGCRRSSGSGSRWSRRTRARRRPVSRRASTAACSSRWRRSARTSCSGSRAASSSAATCG